MTIDRTHFFNHVKASLFGGKMTQGQVEGLNHLLDVWERDFGDKDKRWLAYGLATAFHETDKKMQPIEEYGKGKGKKYGAPVGPHNKTYYGRGHVQLTWEDNYKRANKELAKYNLDVDLHKEPHRALEDEISAYILFDGSMGGWFTGKKYANYFNASTSDPRGARRIINGLDKADLIAGYYQKFVTAV